MIYSLPVGSTPVGVGVNYALFNPRIASGAIGGSTPAELWISFPLVSRIASGAIRGSSHLDLVGLLLWAWLGRFFGLGWVASLDMVELFLWI